MEFSDTSGIIDNLCKIIADERRRDATAPVFDGDEKWMLEEAPALYVIEKASSVIQPANKSEFKMDSLTLKIYKELKSIPVLADYDEVTNPTPQFRTIPFNTDFVYDHSTNSIVRTGQHTTKLNKLINELKKSLFPQTQHFVLTLSLSFGGGDGGHFGGVIGTTDPQQNRHIYIFDPYGGYQHAFVEIITNAIRDPEISQPWRTSTIHDFYDFQTKSPDVYVEIAIHSGIITTNPDPNITQSNPTADQKVRVMDSRGQDHFCWAWCVLYHHIFMSKHCSITDTYDFFNNNFFSHRTIIRKGRVVKNQYQLDRPFVASIKAYIMFLEHKKIISTVYRAFFRDIFKYICHSNDEDNFSRALTSYGRPDPNDYFLRVVEIPNLATINMINIDTLFTTFTFNAVNTELSDALKIDVPQQPNTQINCSISNRVRLVGMISNTVLRDRVRNGIINPNVLEISEMILFPERSAAVATTDTVLDPEDWLGGFLDPEKFVNNNADLDPVNCLDYNNDHVEFLSNTFNLESYLTNFHDDTSNPILSSLLNSARLNTTTLPKYIAYLNSVSLLMTNMKYIDHAFLLNPDMVIQKIESETEWTDVYYRAIVKLLETLQSNGEPIGVDVIDKYKDAERRLSRRKKDKCAFTNKLINLRNQKKDAVIAKGPTCATSVTPVFYYQKEVVRILAAKARVPIRVPVSYDANGRPVGHAVNPDGSLRFRYAGLIAWYGTGTGKTFAAAIAAKALSFCQDTRRAVRVGLLPPVPQPFGIQNCYIISPKSAVGNFAKELMNEGIFSDKLTLGNTDASMFYKAGNIKMYSHPNFERFLRQEGGNVDLGNSLLIIDEAHNFFNIDGKPDMHKTQFMLQVCRRVKQVLVLTATPVANNSYDLETLLAMIDGGRPLASKDEFLRFFPKLEAEVETQNMCNPPESAIPTRTAAGRLPRTANDAEMRAHFEDRIIKYESSNSKDMPEHRDIRACVEININEPKYRRYVQAVLNPSGKERQSNEKGTNYGFGSAERDALWSLKGDNNPKLQKILEIIENRERTPPDHLSIEIGKQTKDFKPEDLKYKYIIFSKYVANLEIIKTYLVSKGILEGTFGEIHGKIGNDSVAERQRIAGEFNNGITRIMLISEAAEEGVDFKRASVVILAEALYNWSEYVQIRGRAVRTYSTNPPAKIKDAQGQDVNPPADLVPDVNPSKLVAEKIESFVVVMTTEIQPNTIRQGLPNKTKTCWDLNSFKQMYRKKYITEELVRELDPYFINIVPSVPPGSKNVVNFSIL